MSWDPNKCDFSINLGKVIKGEMEALGEQVCGGGVKKRVEKGKEVGEEQVFAVERDKKRWLLIRQ